MKKIKIKFCDFWTHFHPQSNYFYELLSKHYTLELCEDPDILIYSCYGNDHLKYSCLRVFYASENIRPNFSGCDFAITFDYNKHPRHFRLPLYALYIDQHPGSIKKLTVQKTQSEALAIWRSKTKFCCMVVSNAKSKKRINFYKKLSKYKKVDSGGIVLNNVGGPVKNKLDFIKDYRFVIAFENSVYPGYTTEKILEPLIVNSIPLYWGNPLVDDEFNKLAFLKLTNFKNETDLINEIIAIDADESKAANMLMVPKFINAEIPNDINKDRLLQFFDKIFTAIGNVKPVALKHFKYLYAFNLKKKYYINRLKGFANKAFR